MKTLVALAVFFPVAAMASLPERVEKEPMRQVIVTQPAPCLKRDRSSRYTVRWVIRNLKTGEVRAIGRQDVRRRC